MIVPPLQGNFLLLAPQRHFFKPFVFVSLLLQAKRKLDKDRQRSVLRTVTNTHTHALAMTFGTVTTVAQHDALFCTKIRSLENGGW